nr:MAG TPA: hypothetical protein [Caudoviricetes sp.]
MFSLRYPAWRHHTLAVKSNVLLNRDFKWSTQELDVRRGSVYG